MKSPERADGNRENDVTKANEIIPRKSQGQGVVSTKENEFHWV